MIRCALCGEEEYPLVLLNCSYTGAPPLLPPERPGICVEGVPHRFAEMKQPPKFRVGRGNNLFCYRDAAELTLHEVEQKTGIAALTVRRYETGVQKPSHGDLVRLSALYRIPAAVHPAIGLKA